MAERALLLIAGAAEVVTMRGEGGRPLTGRRFEEPDVITNGAVAVGMDGRILAVGGSPQLRRRFRAKKTVDAAGKTVTPGFVDPHTHACFANWRDEEFELRIRGATYQEIAARGGGILSSVAKVRAASLKHLKDVLRANLLRMSHLGTTTVEVKSGYGLSTAAELKMLRAISEVSREPEIAARLDVVPTFIGAHEFPAEFRGNREGYVDLLCNEMIPKVASSGLAEFCDVFCEKGVFEIEQSRRILNAAKTAGLKPRLHAEEFATIGGAELAAEVGAVSADHLMAVSERGIAAMGKAGTIAVLLPGTTFFLGLSRYAPARKLIEGGVPVALATDFNPGSSPTVSMPMAMALACTQMRMTPAEALAAATINAAFAVARADSVGSLESGKQADMVLWDAPSHRHIPYRFGDNLVSAVVKRGRVIAE